MPLEHDLRQTFEDRTASKIRQEALIQGFFGDDLYSRKNVSLCFYFGEEEPF